MTERITRNGSEPPMPLENRGDLPTTLDLFRFSPAQRIAYRSRFKESVQIKRELESSARGLRKLKGLAKDRTERLEGRRNEMGGEIRVLNSSIAVGTAYLKMLDEFLPQGVTEQQVFEFFTICLKINTQYWTPQVARQISSTKAHQAIVSLSASLSHEKEKVFFKDLPPKASWFRGNQAEWVRMVRLHSDFDDFLNQINMKYPKGGQILDPDFDRLFYTLSYGLPDWFTENNPRQVPPRTKVEDELDEDLRSVIPIRKRYLKIEEQQNSVNESFNSKIRSATDRVNKRFFEVYFDEPDLPALLMILNSTSQYIRSDVGVFNLLGRRTRVDPERRLSSTETVNETIDAFVYDDQAGLSKELISLFLEKIMRKAGVIVSAKEPLSGGIADILLWYLDAFKIAGAEGKPIALVDEQPKKMYSFLNYELRPLLDLLDQADISEMQDWINMGEQETAEELIWALSELIAPRLIQAQFSGKTIDIANEIRKNAKNWLKNHWEWSHQKLGEALDEKEDVLDQEEALEGEVEKIPEVQEFRRESEEKGNPLNGWSIYYTTDGSLDPKRLVLLVGETPTEQQDWLNNFIGRNKISCSIPPESVLAALGELTTRSLINSFGRPRQKRDVKGVLFYVDKSAGDRIMFRRDDKIKTFIFFIHHKDSWEYTFEGSN